MANETKKCLKCGHLQLSHLYKTGKCGVRTGGVGKHCKCKLFIAQPVDEKQIITLHINDGGDRSVGIQPMNATVNIIHEETEQHTIDSLTEHLQYALSEFYEGSAITLHKDDGKCPVCNEED